MTRKRTPASYKREATVLHSKIVRARGACENCGEADPSKLQCAHIVSRRFSRTRTSLTNAFCLCAKCHMRFTEWPPEFSEFIYEQVGRSRYRALRRQAEDTSVKVDWQAEVERLKTHPALMEAS